MSPDEAANSSEGRGIADPVITCALTDRGIGMCFTTKPGKVAHTTDWNTLVIDGPNKNPRISLSTLAADIIKTRRKMMMGDCLNEMNFVSSETGEPQMITSSCFD